MPSLENRETFSLTFKREIDIDRYPILESHVLDGRPVVPLALIAEWLGHGALHQNPGLMLHGLDDLRLLNGIRIGEEKRIIRLLAGRLKKKGSLYEVDVEVRDGIKEGREVIHSRARVILSDTLSEPPLYHAETAVDLKSYPRTVDEVYEKILFQGEGLHGIQSIKSVAPGGMTARISSAPSPAKWMKEPLRSRWLLDPLVIDSAFQMASIWCHEEKGNVSLPGYCANYRQYCASFPSEGLTAILKVKDVTDRKMTGDYTFLDIDNRVLARLAGYEAIMDPSLIKAFKSQ